MRWAPVKGLEGQYEVSDHGHVRRLEFVSDHGGYRPRKIRGRLLKQGNGQYGKVWLWSKDGAQRRACVHVLVAEAFVPGEGVLVRHLDDNGRNNLWTNLAWGSYLDNSADRIRLGNTGRVLTVEDAVAIKTMLANGNTGRSIARQYGVSEAFISAMRKEKVWRHV